MYNYIGALSSFDVGFRPAWGIVMELAADESCLYERERFWERRKPQGEETDQR